MRHLFTVLFMGILAAGCGDDGSATNGGGGTAGSSNGGGGSAGSTSEGGGGSTSSQTGGAGTGGTGGGNTVTPIAVVINEINATSEDWVELVNTGDEPFDLSSYGVADSDDMGQPKLDAAARFPLGTTLAAGDRLLLVAEQDAAAGVGPHDVCLMTGGPSACYYSTWGISASKGEKIWLLDPGDKLVGVAEYPMNAAAAPNTWGRLPDGTGDFTQTAATPGEANKAP